MALDQNLNKALLRAGMPSQAAAILAGDGTATIAETTLALIYAGMDARSASLIANGTMATADRVPAYIYAGLSGADASSLAASVLGFAGQQLVDDGFLRPDTSTGGLGSPDSGGQPYTYVGGSVWGIISNQAYIPGGQANQSALQTLTTLNQFVEFKYVTSAGAQDLGCDLRFLDQNNRLWLDTFGGGRVFKDIGGALTQIGSFTVANNLTVRLEVVDELVSLYLDGVKQWTVVVPGLPLGYQAGMSSHTGNANYRWKNFRCGDLAPITTTHKAVGVVAGGGSPIAMPSAAEGVAVGDVALMYLSAGSRLNGSGGTPSSPGWTVIAHALTNGGGGDYGELTVLQRNGGVQAGDAGASFTATQPGSQFNVGVIVVYPAGTTVVTSGITQNGYVGPSSSVTGAQVPATVVYMVMSTRSNGGAVLSIGTPSPLFIRRSTEGGSDTHFVMEMSEEPILAAGSVPVRTFVDEQASCYGEVLQLVIKPPVPAAPVDLSPVISGRAITIPGSSQFVAWQPGTAERDLVVIQYASGWYPDALAGWFVHNIDAQVGSGGGVTMSKRMTAADILAGGVTVTTNTGSTTGHLNIFRVPAVPGYNVLENASQSGILQIGDSPSNVEQVVDFCDLTVTTLGNHVVIDYDFWWSMSEGGGGKVVTWRLRRDNLSGQILASGSNSATVDSTLGHDRHIVNQVFDGAPTTGHYVLTIQCTGGFSSPIYSDSRLLRVTSKTPAIRSITGVYETAGFTSTKTVNSPVALENDSAVHLSCHRVGPAVMNCTRGSRLDRRTDSANYSGGIWWEDIDIAAALSTVFSTSVAGGGNQLTQTIIVAGSN